MWIARSKLWWLLSAALWGAAQELPPVCVIDKPAALAGETIRVHVQALGLGARTEYLWRPAAGRVSQDGREVLWSLPRRARGWQTITAKITTPGQPVQECSARVFLLPHDSERGPLKGAALIAGQAEGGPERVRYGAYTYVLLAGPAPDKSTRDRYLAAVSAWRDLDAAMKTLSLYLEPPLVNITYLPVTHEPPSNADAEWLLQHYDFGRARVILSRFPNETGRGPFLLSSTVPLTGNSPAPRQTLIQNLSAVPAPMITYWIESFKSQAAQDQFWLEPARVPFALRLRTLLETAGQVVGPIASAYSDFRNVIGWK
jgi:hypothetical protein